MIRHHILYPSVCLPLELAWLRELVPDYIRTTYIIGAYDHDNKDKRKIKSWTSPLNPGLAPGLRDHTISPFLSESR